MSKLEAHLSITQRLDQIVAVPFSAHALQQGMVLLFATFLGNLLQYLFHFMAGRMLGPTEYGILASLLALGAILTVPGGIAQTVITQYVASFHAHQELERAGNFVVTATRLLAVVGVAAFVLIAVVSPVAASILNIPGAVPIVAMGSMFLFAGPLTTLTGALQGLQRFYGLAIQSVLGPGFRLVAGLVLIGVGAGASGALSATAVSNLIVLALTAVMLRDLLAVRRGDSGVKQSQLFSYTGIVLWGTLAFAVLTNVDLVIVKRFFDPEQTGYYSAASVLGKTILAFPGAVAIVLFPKTTFRHALGQSTADLARKAGIVTTVLCGVGAVGLFLFQTPVMLVMFGEQYSMGTPLVGLYGTAMALYALVQLLMTYYIAQQNARFVWLLVAAAAALGLFLVFFHYSLEFVIVSLAISGAAILVISEVWLQGFGLAKLIRMSRQ